MEFGGRVGAAGSFSYSMKYLFLPVMTAPECFARTQNIVSLQGTKLGLTFLLHPTCYHPHITCLQGTLWFDFLHLSYTILFLKTFFQKKFAPWLWKGNSCSKCWGWSRNKNSHVVSNTRYTQFMKHLKKAPFFIIKQWMHGWRWCVKNGISANKSFHWNPDKVF